MEALRCLLMMLIVVHHCFVHGLWQDAQVWWSFLFTTMIIWHVDSFVSISGWFGIKFSWAKVLRLYGLFAFYSLLDLGYLYFFDRSHFTASAFIISGGWFGGTYLMLMFLSPILNAGLERLEGEGPSALSRALMMLGGAAALAWAPAHLMTGVCPEGFGSQSIMTFIVVYVLAFGIRKLSAERSIKPILWVGFLAFPAFLIVVKLAEALIRSLVHSNISIRLLKEGSLYNAPHVWLFAIALMIVFVKHVKIPERAGRVIAFISPSMFGIYLFHDTTTIGRNLLIAIEQRLSEGLGWHPIAIIALSGVAVFGASLIVDLLRRGVVSVVERRVKHD